MKPEIQIVEGVIEGDTFKVKRYPTYKDLCDPTLRPVFYTRVPSGVDSPKEWVILVIPGEPDIIYKADPRKNDMQREWKQGKEFPDFLPVYQIKRIGRWNRYAKIARGRVSTWVKNEFTFLQTGAQSATPAG